MIERTHAVCLLRGRGARYSGEGTTAFALHALAGHGRTDLPTRLPSYEVLNVHQNEVFGGMWLVSVMSSMPALEYASFLLIPPDVLGEPFSVRHIKARALAVDGDDFSWETYSRMDGDRLDLEVAVWTPTFELSFRWTLRDPEPKQDQDLKRSSPWPACDLEKRRKLVD